jgi:hypothetical protein
MKTSVNPLSPCKNQPPERRVPTAVQTSEIKPAADHEPLFALVASLRDAPGQKASHYLPIARHLIAHRSTNTQEIEHTLDHLLDVACLPEGLAAFKSLCRHYWPINPQATASYIQSYREMWNSDDQPTKEADHE